LQTGLSQFIGAKSNLLKNDPWTVATTLKIMIASDANAIIADTTLKQKIDKIIKKKNTAINVQSSVNLTN